MIEYTTHYCQETDMTFVTKDTYTEQGDPIKTEVIGFYFGEVDEVNEKDCSLTAEF